MNTLIIGGTGFVGSHMLAQSPSWSSTTVVGSDVDVCDKKALNRLFQRIKPAYIVNLAAITTVKETIASPRENYDVIFYMENGEIISSGSYDFLLASCPKFRKMAEVGGLFCNA